MLVVLATNDWQKGGSLLKSLLSCKSSVIREVSTNRSEQIANYRFLNNDKVKEEELIHELTQECSQRVKGLHVLCIQDTSEINLESHRGRIKEDSGLGLVGNNRDLGFFIHPTLVIDAERNHVKGFSHVKIWHRPLDKQDKHERNYKDLPIEEKESYKWIESSQRSKSLLSEAELITIIEDREGDIYEQFATIPDERVNLLIRSTRDRSINEEGGLYKYLSSQEIKGNYKLKISGDLRSNREKREAEISIRFCNVTIKRPKHNKNKELPESICLSAVEAVELNPPQGQRPIHWRILTTHEVTNFNQARQIIEWYKQRWNIEQVFRLLKHKGLRIEDSELESGWAIRKLTVMLLSTVLKILQMSLTLHETYRANSQKIMDLFNEEEVKCLKQLNKEYEGRTEKQKNKNRTGSLRWATWIIARMGGWKGYSSQHPPGVLTLKWGLDTFYDIYFGWRLARKATSKNVYTR
jgi:hypothetical protein